MATSGTVTFRVTRNQLIEAALRIVGGIDPENTVGASAVQITNCSQALNMLTGMWKTRGIMLWERRYGVIFPQQAQGIFVLGSPGPAGDHSCLSTPLGAGFVQTTLSADAASGAGSITVTSLTGSSLSTAGTPATTISDTYNIGIQLDDGSTQWTTVSGTPSGTTVTLAAVLTDSATSGNIVYCYLTKLTRPMRIVDAMIQQVGQENYSPVNVISREEYNRFGNKTTMGTPVQLVYDPQINTGYVYLYNTFLSANQLLFIDFQKAIDDFTGANDDFDLPQEWAVALKFNLAYHIAPEYEVAKDKFQQIEKLAGMTYDQLDGWDTEFASIFLQPGMWAYDNPR